MFRAGQHSSCALKAQSSPLFFHASSEPSLSTPHLSTVTGVSRLLVPESHHTAPANPPGSQMWLAGDGDGKAGGDQVANTGQQN